MATTFGSYVMAAFTVPAGTTLRATTNGGGPTVVTVTAGAYTDMLTFLTQLASDLNSQRPVTAGTWTVTWSHGVGATGFCTIATTAGSYTILWLSTDLRDLLGFTGDIASVSTSTGTNNARGTWHPDAPLTSESGDVYTAPRVTDLRQTEGPTGLLIGHVGNTKYRHRGIGWTHCPKAKVWRGEEGAFPVLAIPDYSSFESFCIDSQWGLGHTWFTPTSSCVIVTHDGVSVGAYSGITNWYLKGVGSMDECVTRAVGGWDGLWAVRVEAVAEGA